MTCPVPGCHHPLPCPWHPAKTAKERREAGERLKADGIESVSGNNAEWLAWIRGLAVEYCHEHGAVTINPLRALAKLHNRFPKHPNAWGAVFHCDLFQPVGEFVKTEEAASHVRWVQVWKLR